MYDDQKANATTDNTKRGQSAVELLSTYAWAFIIVSILVVTVGIYIGIGTGARYIPSQCNIQPLLPCPQTALAQTANQISYKMLIINNLAPYMYFPSNSFIVSSAGINPSLQQNYTGTCAPSIAGKGDEIICTVYLPSTNAPSIGSSVNMQFSLKYQICSSSTISKCESSQYSSTGTSFQPLSSSTSNLYKLNLVSDPNATIFVNGQNYIATFSGSYIYLPLGSYSIYAITPSGYSFSGWKATPSPNNITLFSLLTQNTTMKITGNSTLTAMFNVVSITRSSTTTIIPTLPTSVSSTSSTTTVTTTTSTSTTSTTTSTSSTTTVTTTTSDMTTTSTSTTTSDTTTTIFSCLGITYSTSTTLSANVNVCGDIVVDSGVTLTTDGYSLITGGNFILQSGATIITGYDTVTSPSNSYGGGGGGGGLGTNNYGQSVCGNGNSFMYNSGANGYSTKGNLGGSGAFQDCSTNPVSLALCGGSSGYCEGQSVPPTISTFSGNSNTIQSWYNNGIQNYLEGAAGGEGGYYSCSGYSSGCGSAGGGGGSGSYGLYIQAKSITISGLINSEGQTGLNSVCTGASPAMVYEGGGGGGGDGGGGAILLAYQSGSTAPSTSSSNIQTFNSGFGLNGCNENYNFGPPGDGGVGGGGDIFTYAYTTPPITTTPPLTTTSTSTTSTTTTTASTTGYYTCNVCQHTRLGFTCPSGCNNDVNCGTSEIDCEAVGSTTTGTTTSIAASFVGSTQVLMADGTWENIINIKSGDVIESYNVKTNKEYPNVVIDVPVYTTKVLYTINSNLTTDGFEVFYTNINGTYQWIHASNLKVGQNIMNPITGKYIKIKTISVLNSNVSVSLYDIIGASGNDYIVDGGYLADKLPA